MTNNEDWPAFADVCSFPNGKSTTWGIYRAYVLFFFLGWDPASHIPVKNKRNGCEALWCHPPSERFLWHLKTGPGPCSSHPSPAWPSVNARCGYFTKLWVPKPSKYPQRNVCLICLYFWHLLVFVPFFFSQGLVFRGSGHHLYETCLKQDA